jgi:hypothetical protein
LPWSHGHSKRCDPQAPVDVQTPLPDLLSALRLARTAGSSAGIQERRDPRLAPRGRGLAPTTQPTTLLLARPGRPRGVDPPPLPKAASAPSIRDARDIAALASGPDQTPLEVPAPPARSALDGARTASPDPADGSGEPTWGYRRIHGELAQLGQKVASSTVWLLLRRCGIDPAPGGQPDLAAVPGRPGRGTLACDFFHAETVLLKRLYCCSCWRSPLAGSISLA